MDKREFLIELKISNISAHKRIKYIKSFKNKSTKMLVCDEYGDVLVYPYLLLNGSGWSIASSVDKKSYFLNMLKERNIKAYNTLKLIDDVKSLDKHVLFEDKYGIVRAKPNNILNGSIPTIESALNKTNYFLAQLKEKNGRAYECLTMLDDYINGKSKIRFKDDYGILYIPPSRLLEGHIYGINSAIDKSEYWVNQAIEKHGNTYNYNKVSYNNSLDDVEIVCKKHGSFFQKPAYHLSGCGCPICNSSKSEKIIIELLNSKGIFAISQHTFENCKHKSELRFDFYLPTLNTVIESDGEQHYMPVNFGGISDEKANQEFEKCKIRDGIKNKYCKDNDIKLIRIPYWDFGRIEETLLEQLKQLNVQNT